MQFFCAAAIVVAGAAWLPAAAQADFGFQPGGLEVTASNADGSVDTQAGSHPFEFTTTVSLNTTTREALDPLFGFRRLFGVPDGGNVKDIEVSLPPGFVGDPSATPQCPFSELTSDQLEFDNEQYGLGCPSDTQVGYAALKLGRNVNFVHPRGGGFLFPDLYNLVPPKGQPAAFGMIVRGLPIVLVPSVRTGGDYGLDVASSNIGQGLSLLESKVTLWGVPGDPAHDPFRGPCLVKEEPPTEVGAEEEFELDMPESKCSQSYGAQVKPFLSLPSSCTGPLPVSARMDPYAEPGVFVEEKAQMPALTGCQKVAFTPSLSVQPESEGSQAGSPSGLNVDIHTPQNTNIAGISEGTLKRAEVTLPEGVVVNPAAASGLGACTPEQIGLKNADPVSCPLSSKLGSVEIDTPVLPEPLTGSVFAAQQGNNPFGSLLALYVVAEGSGVLIKSAGEVRLDPNTGQIRTVFDEVPEQPTNDIKLHLFGGPRAALSLPRSCGTYTTASQLSPYSGGAASTPTSAFPLGTGPGGTACGAPESFKPGFAAGTVSSLAGTFSPFELRLKRTDPESAFAALSSLRLPPGLLASLKGVPYCPEADLRAASTALNPGQTGAAEILHPSCPAASLIGHVTVGAGAGSNPFYTEAGRAYLAGPYKGAPLSLAVTVPAVAGPFDLGDVLVRSALFVDPETTQITAVSDPFPTILDGIPLQVRDIRLAIDRPDFTVNPTSCSLLQIGAALNSTANQAANLSAGFQPAACNALAFAPKLALALKGGTKRHSFPALTATLTYPQGPYANIKTAQVTLPHSEFLEQGHIGTVCTRVQFAAGSGNGSQCPKASIYGHAQAVTPLLDQPIEGPVYLRSSSHKLPDLVAALGGQIDVDLDGRIDTGKGGGIRNTFEAVPDAPVSKFTLQLFGGKKGLLVNSEDICAKAQHAIADFTGQNGKVYDTNPTVTNSCKGGGGATKKGKAPRHSR